MVTQGFLENGDFKSSAPVLPQRDPNMLCYKRKKVNALFDTCYVSETQVNIKKLTTLLCSRTVPGMTHGEVEAQLNYFSIFGTRLRERFPPRFPPG